MSTKLEDRVKHVGCDRFGRPCYQYQPGGKRYCGKNAKQRAIKQGYAKEAASKKLVDSTLKQR